MKWRYNINMPPILRSSSTMELPLTSSREFSCRSAFHILRNMTSQLLFRWLFLTHKSSNSLAEHTESKSHKSLSSRMRDTLPQCQSNFSFTFIVRFRIWIAWVFVLKSRSTVQKWTLHYFQLAFSSSIFENLSTQRQESQISHHS